MIQENKLLRAVLKRSFSRVQNCIVDGEDPNYKDEHGRSYLHLSVFLRSEELVEFFLTEGLGVNHTDNDNLTALHRACRNGFAKIIPQLYRYGAKLNARAANDITPLHIASAFGHINCVRNLLKIAKSNSELDIDARDENYHTPLHYAAADDHINIAAELIRRSADVNAANISGNRPIHFAAYRGASELCQLLFLKPDTREIDAQNHKGQTALHLATQNNCTKTVAVLTNLGADPNLRDEFGNTCLHLAFKTGNIELINILIKDPRTDTSISDDENNTVIHLALKLGHHNLVPMMLRNARDLTRQNASGCTVIIEAIKNQLEDLALHMLSLCPTLVHIVTHDLVTPLHLAAERGMTKLTKQLLIAGAQVDAVDSTGLTPSLYCAKNDSVLECLAMIENIMMMSDNNTEENHDQQQNHTMNISPTSPTALMPINETMTSLRSHNNKVQ